MATPIFSEVSAAMTGLFKVNGVGTLWLPGNDEVMAKEVGADCLGIMAWYGDLRGFYGNEMIFVVGASMRMLVTGGNECTNTRQAYKIVCLVIM